MPTFFDRDGVSLHYAYSSGNGTPLVFANSLGTDFRIWDDVVAGFPNHPVLRIDKRGHGLSGNGPTSIAILAEDLAALMEHLGLSGALICGVSVGGLIAQQLGHARPDLAARLVLMDTGMKIGTDAIWNERIEIAQSGGTEAMADAVMDRWFSASFKKTRQTELAGYRTMLCTISNAGYADVSRAIRDCDLSEQTPHLTQPCHVLVGGDDQATPPALNKALADAIPGASYSEVPGVGHLPCIETPDAVIAAIQSTLNA
ncbi:3-oxoadipate enol-lactonase [Pseudaestuariivita sp.]|uniref:3-oxoadipate enol-lactonase n=1 Tax=Pseudaestuariivita sp. TaxID=2211669 RepID=UPI0040584E38